MKTRFFVVILAAFLAVARTGISASFTNESVAELSATIDPNGDGSVALIVVDKVSGVRQLATPQSDGTFVWAEPASTGFDDVTALTIGRFTPSSSAEGYAVAAPAWNRVNLWPADSLSPTAVPSPGIGPNLAVALDFFGGDNLDDLAIATIWDSPPDTTRLGGCSWDGTDATPDFSAVEIGPLSRGNPARFKDTEAWLLGAIRPAGTGSEFITRPAAALGFATGPTVSSLPADAAWARGEFDATGFATFLFYAPDTSVTMQVRPAIDAGSAQFDFGLGFDFDFPDVVSQIFVVPTSSGGLLLVIFGDGTTAQTYDFDGTHPPTLRQTLTAPPGSKFSLAGGLGGGNFLLLNGPNGGRGSSTGWQRWNLNGGQHTLAASGSIPPISLAHGRANVLIYPTDPNLSPDAPLLRLLRAADWSVSSSFQSVNLQVTALHLLNSSTGLGSPTQINLGSGFTGDFAELNQLASAESIVSVDPPVGQPPGDLSFSPPAGAYSLATGQSLTVQITASPSLPVSYRTSNSQPWTAYDPAAPPQISATTTFQAYAGAPFGPASGITPIRAAAYTIAPPPGITPPATVDANKNGLGDGWENAFGLHDPDGDADHDGFTNRDEYLAGTDPFDPNSKPTASDFTGVRLIIRRPGVMAPAGTLCELAWPSNLIGAILETTTDVGGSVPWTTVSTATNAITTTDTERIYFDPVTPGEPKRFFRLRRAQ